MNLIRKRLSAFFLDMLLVIFVSVCLSNLNYLNPYKYKYESTVDEYNQVYEEYATSILNPTSSSYLGKDEVDQYMIDNIVPLTHKVEKYNIFYLLWYLLIYFMYFVVFAHFNNGQTLGKKLFKIKITDKNGEIPSILKLLFRSIFNGSSLYLGLNITIIMRIILTFISDMEVYYYAYTFLNLAAYIFEFSLVIIFFTKKGHISTNDLIAKTEVIEE